MRVAPQARLHGQRRPLRVGVLRRRFQHRRVHHFGIYRSGGVPTGQRHLLPVFAQRGVDQRGVQRQPARCGTRSRTGAEVAGHHQLLDQERGLRVAHACGARDGLGRRRPAFEQAVHGAHRLGLVAQVETQRTFVHPERQTLGQVEQAELRARPVPRPQVGRRMALRGLRRVEILPETRADDEIAPRLGQGARAGLGHQRAKALRHRQFRIVVRRIHAAGVGQAAAAHGALHGGELERVAMRRQVLVRDIADVLAFHLRELRQRRGRLREAGRAILRQSLQPLPGAARPGQAVAGDVRGAGLEHAPQRQQLRPAGHGVVADHDQAAGLEAGGQEGVDLLACRLRHPTVHAVQHDEVELRQVLLEHLREAARQQEGVAEARFATQPLGVRDVRRVQVAGMEAAARMRRRQGERGDAAAAAQVAPGELAVQARRRISVDGGDVGQPGRRQVGVEVAGVLDVGQIAWVGRGRCRLAAHVSAHMRSRL